MGTGGVIKRRWVLQFTIIIHRQSSGRRIHSTSCKAYNCICPNCPGTHVQIRGTYTVHVIFYKINRNRPFQLIKIIIGPGI